MLIISEDKYLKVKVIIDEQTAIVENEETNYEDKTKAEGVLEQHDKNWIKVQEEYAACQEKLEETMEEKAHGKYSSEESVHRVMEAL